MIDDDAIQAFRIFRIQGRCAKTDPSSLRTVSAEPFHPMRGFPVFQEEYSLI